MIRHLLHVTLVVCATAALCAGEAAACYLKDGDRWAFYGDSISAAGVYQRALERVVRHFHPDARITFINNAVNGKPASGATAAEAAKGDPTIVSIMLGMNDAINGPWIKGMPVEPALERYRADLTRLVRGLRAEGRDVLLLTPTLTDETVSPTIFRLEGTADLLRQMGAVCAEVATAEHVDCLPIQDDVERFQASLPLREQRLRYDGVHLTADGQYRFARSLWTRLHVAGPLATGQRRLGQPDEELAVEAALERRLLPQDALALDVRFAATEAMAATLTWSAGAARGSSALALAPQAHWRPDLPASAFPAADGLVSDLVVDVENGGRRAVFLVDLSRNALLHLKDGRATGSIDSAVERPEGARVCDYAFASDGKTLSFSAAIRDDHLVSDRSANAWPWNGDCLTLYLDLRPLERFAGNALERDVYQLWFQPQEAHGFAPGFRPWYGKGMDNAASPFGSRTADGYTVGFAIDSGFTLHDRLDISSREFIAFDLACVDNDGPKAKTVWHILRKTQLPTFLYASSLTVIDLKGTWPGDTICIANLFPSQAGRRP